MTKRKLARFAENLTFPNMFQVSYEEQCKGFIWKGRWKEYFKNNHPVILEVGCGKGEYSVNLAERCPQNNYIGIDVKGARMWRGCKTSQQKGLTNVAFIRTYVQVLEQYFAPGEVSEIWITFPDPQPRQSREKRRLTHPRFLKIYEKLLKPNGRIHLKTDNKVFFDYTLSVIQQQKHMLHFSSADLYNTPDAPPETTSIQTFYEKMFLEEGVNICYLTFSLHQKADQPRLTRGTTNSTFFDKVYEVARLIPFGRVTSYGAIAKYLGTGLSARTVGWAMNSAHSDVLNVPAHRVVNRNGMLTGKHHFGAPDVMQQLLENEGLTVINDQIVDFNKYFWDPAIELL